MNYFVYSITSVNISYSEFLQMFFDFILVCKICSSHVFERFLFAR